MSLKTLVVVPTYNERDNVQRMVEAIAALDLDADVRFIDDNSPDGTGDVLDTLSASHARLFVSHRVGKAGIGSAHLDGIAWAYANGYERLVTLDGDFSHSPADIPAILREADGADLVVGSRWISANSLSEWNLFRRMMTGIGHTLTRVVLGLPYDATSAFRAYRLDRIPREAFSLVRSPSYAFFFESLFILHRHGCRVQEMPIVLPARTYGHSKMTTRVALQSVRIMLGIAIEYRLRPDAFALAFPVASPRDEQGWDEYWAHHKMARRMFYDPIAAFYRKVIIKRNLNRFVRGNFKPGATLLHAGCGSGQVDTDIREYASITALDVSTAALDLYRRTNGEHCNTLRGSILEIPLANASVDGVYNLGVMEHFTESEISRAMSEFRRVVRPGGRLVIFWPPEFGMSVLFFKALTWVFETLLRRKDVKFHPAEMSRVRSRKQVMSLFERAGFGLVQYYFGMQDAFTYAVIVAERPLDDV